MTDFVLLLHSYNVYLVLVAAAVTGVWGLFLYFRKMEVQKAWRILLIVTAALSGIQALLGITLVTLGLKPGTGTDLYYLHYVYGAIVALGIPVAVTYATGGQKPRRDMLIFSIAALVLLAAGVRAFMTGPAQ